MVMNPAAPRPQAPAPCPLDYLDYRAFLKDWVDARKTAKIGFSLRAFSTRLGISGTSFLSAVLGAKKNLGDELRIKLGQALGLPPEQEQFFQLLVQFNQAKELETKNHWFRQLQKYRGSRARTIGEGQWRFYDKWYFVAVWNWFGLRKRYLSAEQLGLSLQPVITAAQVEEAIATLLELGLLRKTANGYETCEVHLTTAPEAASRAAKNHILELNQIAATQLQETPPALRQYNTLMFQVSPQGYAAIKERIRQFQEELRDILDRDQKEDRIYALSMALFPLSQIDNNA